MIKLKNQNKFHSTNIKLRNPKNLILKIIIIWIIKIFEKKKSLRKCLYQLYLQWGSVLFFFFNIVSNIYTTSYSGHRALEIWLVKLKNYIFNFQNLNSHMWLLATILDSTCLQ